jgi:hypothetical protein
MLNNSVIGRRLTGFVLLGLLAALIFTMPLFAQTSKGSIAGTVSDTTGAVISGAKVTATSKDTGEVRTMISGPTGSFRMDALSLGTYQLSITKEGFKTLSIGNIVVQASIITPIDAKLTVGATGTTVEVQAQANTVNTENGELSYNISTIEIASLPLSTLNPIQIELTQPGVVDAGSRNILNGSTGFSVNGLSPRSTNFLIDGQDDNDNALQGQAFQPQNAEAVKEVSILTNSYSAEFGRGGAAVSNLIYKGGTNQLHGSAWELYEGSGLNAMDPTLSLDTPATRADKARYDTHTYGFSIGGPVKKDKLFFFASSQWQRYYGKATPSVIAAPTALGAQELQAYGSPNALLLLQYYGNLRAPTGTIYPTTSTGGTVEFGKTTRPAPAQQSPDTQWNVKVDYNVTSKDVFSVRYLHDRSSLSPDFYNFSYMLPGFDTQQGGPSENVGITETHTFGTSAVNEFRASWGHFDFQFAPTAATAANPLYTLPRFSIAGISGLPSTIGVPTNIPQGRGHQTYQFQDGFTYTHGKHVTKVGADITRMMVNDHIPFNFFGSVGFASNRAVGVVGDPTYVPAYSAFANYLDNYTGAGTATITHGSNVATPHILHQAFFVQDTWKVLTNLTLDLGLRYEFQPNPENYLGFPAYDMAVGPFNNNPLTPIKVSEDTNNWGPRVGLSYSPHFFKALFGEDKTVIRAGFGIFYDSLFTNILDNAQGSSPNAVAAISPNTAGRGLPNALQLVSTLSPIFNPLSTQTTVASNLTNPQIYQWNLNIQRELPWKLLLTTSYVGTRGTHLLASETINPLNFGSGVRINPLRGPITVRDNGADSVYHGFNAMVERKFSGGVMLRSAYTFGKAIDDGSDVMYNLGGYTVVPANPLKRSGERGLSDFNAKQRWVTTYVWRIPGAKWDGNALAKTASYITRNWEVSGTLSLQSGFPSTLYIYGIDTNGDGTTTNDRPTLGNPAAPITSVGVDGAFAGGTPGVLYNNDTGAVVTANDVHWIIKPGMGNVGRNTFINPGFWNTNMQITRHVKLPKWETKELLFHADMLNMMNHPNEDNGIDTAVNDGQPNFLNPWYARSGYRVIRMGLKFTF